MADPTIAKRLCAGMEPLTYDRSAERPSLAEQVAAWARRGGA